MATISVRRKPTDFDKEYPFMIVEHIRDGSQWCWPPHVWDERKDKPLGRIVYFIVKPKSNA